MKCTVIMGIVVSQREQEIPKVQDILTKFGNIIMARIGLHENNKDDNSEQGLIILRLCGPKADIDALYKEIEAVDGVKANIMSI